MYLGDRNKTVFILGAGASYGDTLVDFDDDKETDCRIPLTNQFFRPEFLGGEIEDIKREYSDLIEYIKTDWNNNWPLGSGRWEHLNLEDVFTSLAIENEFAPSDTDEKAKTQLRLNNFKKYIRKLIGKNSLNKYGKFTRQLVENLKTQDSIITFNYDLLIDEAFIQKHSGEGALHYEKFSVKLLGRSLRNPKAKPPRADQGLYLKMHGSLNWFLCTNNFCPNSDKPWVSIHTNECLAMSQHGKDYICLYCAGLLTPYLIPPLLNKLVLRDKISRNIWSNALAILRSASKIVIIGYSFPATDFYSEWLFRTALKGYRDVKIWVVNPLNDSDNDDGGAFEKRMSIITQHKKVTNYYRFDQINEILSDVRSKA
ncbi:MAG: hypothetical protein QOE96_3789 [Blastocatellia bacterium]|nr:hypothetical protein [Blastocatellia bacterium]